MCYESRIRLRRCLEQKRSEIEGERNLAGQGFCFVLLRRMHTFISSVLLRKKERKKEGRLSTRGKKKKNGWQLAFVQARRYQSILSSNNKGEDIYHMQPRAPEDKITPITKKQKKEPPKYSVTTKVEEAKAELVSPKYRSLLKRKWDKNSVIQVVKRGQI